MKQLKPRDKVTQHMTRDGLMLDKSGHRRGREHFQPGGRTGLFRSRAGRHR